MNVYAETNFVLELALLQNRHSSCEALLALPGIRLCLPAFSLAEPYETLVRRHHRRQRIKVELDAELRQISRTTTYSSRARDFSDLANLLLESAHEEALRLEATRSSLLRQAEIIPLDAAILESSAGYQERFDLSAQDAIVLASVLYHLNKTSPAESCFIDQDVRDFDDPEIVEQLNRHNCKFLQTFTSGLEFVRSRLRRGEETEDDGSRRRPP